MTQFFRLLYEMNKAHALSEMCTKLRNGETDPRHFEVAPNSFNSVPGKPFAYWMSDSVRHIFQSLPAFEAPTRNIRVGLQTGDDFRFVRGWWEVSRIEFGVKWYPFAKGGTYSPYYADVHLYVNWEHDGKEMRATESSVIRNAEYYFRPGLTWGDRTSNLLSVKPWPTGGIFSVKGSAGFFEKDKMFFILGLMNSKAFNCFLEMMVNAGSTVSRSYQVGVIGAAPYPTNNKYTDDLKVLARRAWSLKRKLDTAEETSHAFLLPSSILARLNSYDPYVIEAEMAYIQNEIDEITFNLYGFSEVDKIAVVQRTTNEAMKNEESDTENNEDILTAVADTQFTLFSWIVGIAFGRFDLRLATGERDAPPEPDPFDPVPIKSPGMLPDDAEPFHRHAGILVDDESHVHDLPRLIEQVQDYAGIPARHDIRYWLRRDFFPLHLQMYSKSRRKAPIYWPLSTASGSFTIWLYYPDLTSQTLFTAVNDFIAPKLEQVCNELNALQTKSSSRNKQEEKQLEALFDLEQELTDLRDSLLEIAPKYHPNQVDGVQITAAPLWSLFRHKPWQKLLKDTWKKLENGDYDWAHLAFSIWPERVLRKCHQDRSLAIAHDVEEAFWHEVEVPAKRSKKTIGETKMERQPKTLTEAELKYLIQSKIEKVDI